LIILTTTTTNKQATNTKFKTTEIDNVEHEIQQNKKEKLQLCCSANKKKQKQIIVDDEMGRNANDNLLTKYLYVRLSFALCKIKSL